jgi:hypothetical protein
MARDDRHSYGQLSRFLDAAALAECEVTEADPPPRLIPQLAPLTAGIDQVLDSLWGPG